ncbi:MAG: rhodanese-like domain-containing protein [Deltaproteobacteria bacterium]|jgi:rhodanese-related sulfurtransferase|nr:rhodanese-like domain-containing protein [Deltaproteobacteria bacterium]
MTGKKGLKLAGFVIVVMVMLSGWTVSMSAPQGKGETGAAARVGSVSGEEKIFRSIKPEEALRLLQSRDDILFLDVRSPQERAQGVIAGSTQVSIFDLVKGKLPLPKDKPILLVCAVGGRSYVAGQVLSRQGFREVYNLSGGINGWYRAGLPVTMENPAAR